MAGVAFLGNSSLIAYAQEYSQFVMFLRDSEDFWRPSWKAEYPSILDRPNGHLYFLVPPPALHS